jgi:hypothetical protein
MRELTINEIDMVSGGGDCWADSFVDAGNKAMVAAV